MANATESAEVRREATAEGPIVFYDGDCGLCARSVSFVLRHDKSSLFRYAPLQGETAERLIGTPQGPSDAWSFVLLDKDGVYDRSTAALKVLQRVKWGWFLPALALVIPRFLRDGVYRFVAKIRHRVWGENKACSLLTPSQRVRFLP